MIETFSIVTMGLLVISILMYKKNEENISLKEKIKISDNNIAKITSLSVKIIRLEKELDKALDKNYELDISLIKSNLQLQGLDALHVKLNNYENRSQTLQDELRSTKDENLKFKTLMDEQNKEFEDFKNDCTERLYEAKQNLENEKQKNDFNIEEIDNYKTNVSRLEKQIEDSIYTENK